MNKQAFDELCKQASTALVRRMAKGMVSPASVSRAAKAMPEGKFRTIGDIGTGAFTTADRVVGNVGGHAGEMVRKMLYRDSPNYVAEGKAMQSFIAKLNDTHRKRVMFNTGKSTEPIVAPILDSNSKGVFQRLADGKPHPDQFKILSRRAEDLGHNAGRSGQYFDVAPNRFAERYLQHNLGNRFAPGVPTNAELFTRTPLSQAESVHYGLGKHGPPKINFKNNVRRLYSDAVKPAVAPTADHSAAVNTSSPLWRRLLGWAKKSRPVAVSTPAAPLTHPQKFDQALSVTGSKRYRPGSRRVNSEGQVIVDVEDILGL